ncbi:MAG: cupin domain-containing protein [Candidatus Nanohaloarchaea archaeon]|nr:cupin domain-containing protein [Candidatus Nanohaloarchaea archaeon]
MLEDVPWGAEELVMSSDLEFDGEVENLAVKRVEIENDEMTAYHRHREKNEIVLVKSGLVEIRLEDDYSEVGEGEAHFIEAGNDHQLQNIGGGVAEIVEIGFPFNPDDVVMVEDPYSGMR